MDQVEVVVNLARLWPPAVFVLRLIIDQAALLLALIENSTSKYTGFIMQNEVTSLEVLLLSNC